MISDTAHVVFGGVQVFFLVISKLLTGSGKGNAPPTSQYLGVTQLTCLYRDLKTGRTSRQTSAQVQVHQRMQVTCPQRTHFLPPVGIGEEGRDHSSVTVSAAAESSSSSPSGGCVHWNALPPEAETKTGSLRAGRHSGACVLL